MAQTQVAPVETLFRFLNIRGPQSVPESDELCHFTRFDRVRKSPLHQEVLMVNKEFNSVMAIVDNFLKSAGAILEFPNELEFVSQLVGAGTVAEAKQEAMALLGKPVGELWSAPDFQQLRTNVWDTYYAQVVAPEIKKGSASATLEALRALHFIELLVTLPDTARMLDGDELSSVRALLPDDILPRPANIPASEEYEREVAKATRQFSDGIAKVAQIWSAAEELRQLQHVGRTFPLYSYSFTSETVGEVQKISSVYEPTQPWPYSQQGQAIMSESAKDVLKAREAKLSKGPFYAILQALMCEAEQELADLLHSTPSHLLSLALDNKEAIAG